MYYHYPNKENNWMILFSFFISFILEVCSWPIQIQNFKPSCLFLFLIYWVLVLPNKVSIGISFLLGIVMDCITKSILGTWSLAFITNTYFMHVYLKKFFYMHIIKQMFSIMCLSTMTHIIVLFIHMLLKNFLFSVEIFYFSFLNSITWPFIYFFTKKTRMKIF